MPLTVPTLDDRNFDDLVRELLARIPGHTPEWTHPAPGDPGRTVLELFAWLVDTLLYRVNRIPERQRLAFLKLLHIPVRPATPARGLLVLDPSNPKKPEVASVPVGTAVTGPVPFETTGEIMVCPLEGEAYVKRAPTPDEAARLQKVLEGLQSIYGLGGARDTPAAMAYITTPVFAERKAQPSGVNIADAVDGCLWMALLSPSGADPEAVRRSLSRGDASPRVLNMGWSPAIQVPGILEILGPRGAVAHEWEITSSRAMPTGDPEYLTLEVVEDGTRGLLEEGVIRLLLPDVDDVGAPENDLEKDLFAGVGDRPPRLDDADKASRLVAWIRLRPTQPVQDLSVTWAGINAVCIDQRRTLRNLIIGVSDGTADQEFNLPGASVDPESLTLQVEEARQGFVSWRRTPDLATAGRDDRVYELDSEAGSVRFGDGVRGHIPPAGMRIRVETMRFGGGRSGNLPIGSLTAVSHPKCKAFQPLATSGGEDPESTEEAEKRIPAVLRHANRAVTEEDYRQLAAETPAVRLGRVEVLARFKPQQRRFGVPGVVSVLVLPLKEDRQPPCPRPDRLCLERVHAYLDARRPLGTELYVIGTEYKPVAVSAAVRIREGHRRDLVLQNVRRALKEVLWPLPPGGFDGAGWPLGGAVVDRDLEVAVARVTGVRQVTDLRLFSLDAEGWKLLSPTTQGAPVVFALEPWQLPELLRVVCLEGDHAPESMERSPLDHLEPGTPVLPIPVVPEVC